MDADLAIDGRRLMAVRAAGRLQSAASPACAGGRAEQVDRTDDRQLERSSAISSFTVTTQPQLAPACC